MAARHEAGNDGEEGARGVPARAAALARGTLTLALSHEGRGDPLAAVRAWFRLAGLIAALWIPAFAEMTGGRRARASTTATPRLRAASPSS